MAGMIANRLLSVASLIAFFILWEAVGRSSLVTPFMLPALSDVLARIWVDAIGGPLWQNIGATLYRAMTGFAIAILGGVLLGLLVARSRIASWIFDPLISLGFPMPKITFLPVFILWFGVYDNSKIIMVVCDAIFPVLTATIACTQAVDRHLLWSARNLGARGNDPWWSVVLPAALPQILSGIQVALPIALIVAVLAEMLMGGTGIGAAMMGSWRFADSRGVFAGLIEISAVGYVLIQLMSLIRRRLLVWHAEEQAALHD